MEYIDAQPIEFKDFSGGQTDHVLQGDAKRFERADNYLITVDRKLEVRPGTRLYDPTAYSLPGASGRIANLFTGINETVLFAHADRNIYTQSPGAAYGNPWAAILGPDGGEALSAGERYHQLSSGEFQRQVYYTSDALTLPGKLFRDQNNVWKALTAGLPKQAFVPNYPDKFALILDCITLANAIRASMISHFTSAGANAALYQHSVADKWSLGYLQAVSAWTFADVEFPGPIPAPTPAPAATDEASLYTLCEALGYAYEHHRDDLAGPDPATSVAGGDRDYHRLILLQTDSTGTSGVIPGKLGINAKMKLAGSRVNTAAKAAAFLDELYQKWYWHQLSPFSHSPTNNYALMSAYLVSATKIGQVYSLSSELQVDPNYTDFIAFSDWIRQVYDFHTQNTGSQGDVHGQADDWGPITLPAPTDFDSAALTIFWVRWLFGTVHSADANWPTHTRVTFDGTAGSANITNVKTTATGVALTLPLESWIITSVDRFNDTDPDSRRVARVLVSAAGTATLDKTCITTAAGKIGQYSSSFMHGHYVSGDFTTDSTVTDRLVTEDLASGNGAIGVDLDTWIAAGLELLNSLGAHEANAKTHRSANVLSNDLQGTSLINSNPFFVPESVTLAWASHYRYQYVVEPSGILYVNQGPPVYSRSLQTCPSYPVGTVITSPSPTYWPNATILVQSECATIYGIPVLANTTLTNYDTSVSVVPTTTTPGESGYNQNLTIELYRTTDGGTTFYKMESIINSTVSYTDFTNENSPLSVDETLNLQPVLYTSGGVLANDPPPECKYTHTFDGYTYYGAILDAGQYFPQRIRQSLRYEPDSSPLASYDDLEDELMGISSTKTNLIALCKASLFRVSGAFTSTGQGEMTHDRIAGTIGCISTGSIVKTEVGVFFAGTDGFYFTDGYQLIKISLDLDKTYQKLTVSDSQKARIVGSYDKLTHRIWWSLQSSPTGQDADVFFTYYLDFGVKPSGVFTRSKTKLSWMPASHTFFQGKLIIGDSRGYLFKSDPTCKTDPFVETGLAVASWATTHIPYDFRSCSMDMGSTGKRKWVTKLHFVGENIGNAAVQIYSVNDKGKHPSGAESKQALAPFQYTKNVRWGDPTLPWGSSAVAWKYDGTLDLWRRFPSRSLRSDFKQVIFQPADVVVYKYDDYPEFAFTAVNPGAKTATLATPAGYSSLTFPKDVRDMYIAFDTDEYATRYLITALDATKKIITFADASGSVVTAGAAKWQISGIRKEQRHRITSFSIHSAFLGDENQAYPGATGEGGEQGNSG